MVREPNTGLILVPLRTPAPTPVLVFVILVSKGQAGQPIVLAEAASEPSTGLIVISLSTPAPTQPLLLVVLVVISGNRRQGHPLPHGYSRT